MKRYIQLTAGRDNPVKPRPAINRTWIRELHVINDKGKQVTMSWEKLRMINDDNSNQDKYTHDVGWYLNNGYSIIDDMINEFETLPLQ